MLFSHRLLILCESYGSVQTVNCIMPWEALGVGGTFSNATDFFKEGVSTRHFSTSHVVPPPGLPLFPLPCSPTTTFQKLHSGSDAPAGAFPMKDGWSGLIMTNACHNQADHDRGKFLLLQLFISSNRRAYIFRVFFFIYKTTLHDSD